MKYEAVPDPACEKIKACTDEKTQLLPCLPVPPPGHGRKGPPSTTITEPDKKIPWTRRDYILLAFSVLIKFGDAVEIYLPGVITQAVSCDLEVGHAEEGFLGVAMYVAMAGAILVAGYLSDRLGRRFILLISLYTSIIFTIICSIVPNYYTLLLSRVLIGTCVGLNISTSGVFFAEEVSSKRVYNFGTFLANLFYAIGGGWVAILGYLLLERIGWRVFIVCTSLPLFIPPIIMLHFSLDMTKQSPDSETGIQRKTAAKVVVPNIGMRIFKASVTSFISLVQGYGSILLLPVLLRALNEQQDGTADTNRCQTTVHGNQFLMLGLVSGGANFLGRALGYIFFKRFRFRTLQSILSVIIALSYGALLLPNITMTMTVIAMSIAKMVYSMMRLELTLMECDVSFFGTSTIAVASAIMMGSGMTGAVAGNAFAVFLTPYVAVLCTFVLSWGLVVAVWNITER